jgi:hypothetical protein
MTTPSEDQHWVAGLPFSSGTGFAGRLSKWGGTLVLTDEAVGFARLGDTEPDRRIPLTEVVEVSAYADKPPRLRITPRTGKPLVMMVSRSRRATARSADTSARDEAVIAIRARVERAGGAL